MATIINFTPKKELSAQQNLCDLIILAKEHLVLWTDIEGFSWESSSWPTSHCRVRFTNHENRSLHPAVVPDKRQLMHPAFIDFAKAYLRYRHSVTPHKNSGREMTALRALEFVLREEMGTPDITKVDQRHFDRAIIVVKSQKSHQFVIGEMLKILATLADFFIITSNASYWKNPFTGIKGYEFTNGGKASAEVKAGKVPDQDALLAIAEVFGRGHTERLDDVDIMVTSLTAILLSAPMRVTETIRFRLDCLGSDTDKDGKRQYFLKYWVPKTREFARKPIPGVMAETAIEAIRRLTAITEDGRHLARYMETNPAKFYRHTNCPNVPDDQELTRDQVAQALGFAHRKSVEDFIKKHTGNRKLTDFTLNSLWQIVLTEHRESNPHFPYQESLSSSTNPPPKMSQSLLCARRFQFGVRVNASPVLLAPFNRDYYAKRLDATVKRDRINERPLCFFTRHGFKSTKFKSHGPRHLLNRLARRSGVSVDEITAWSNRSSSRQTMTYLNDDPAELAAKAATMMGMTSEQKPKAPITDEEAEMYGQGPFHRSRYGLCRRSWRAGPCNKFADCLNCSELLMCKGDKVAATIISMDRSNLVKTFNVAQEAIDRGERAASRWTMNAAPQIELLNQLLAIHNDPTIPDGSPLERVGTDFSHEQTLIDEKANAASIKLLDRNKLAIEYGSELLECLDQLWKPTDA